ncbi:MAG: flagellar basal-body rod protein FlgF [Geobacteraceae bacterium]|jgi:flagellar basal-body rod protein FlgF
MNSGMYSAVSGNIAAMERMDVIANNLANINTAGFKKDRMIFDSMLNSAKNPTLSAGTVTDAPVLSGYSIETDFSAGPQKQTGNPLDLALDGSGFFVVNTPQGKAYTRQGSFHLDGNGKVVTADGYEVQGGGGPITIKGGKVEINEKGELSVDGQQVTTLSVVDFPKPYQLQKIGSALFVPSVPETTEQPTTNTNVRQGAIEDSNVQPLQEMVNLMENSRFYERCVKTVQSYDQMANKAANELGKV